MRRRRNSRPSITFRFEEPDGANIVSHARRIEGTVRREDTSRRDKRRERKERKLAEKERLKAEVRRLKNLKREEIQRKMAQIASVGGLAGAEAVAAANLNKEFDPEEHDRLAAQMYNEEYYEAGPDADEEELEKPVFGDLDEEVAALVGKGGVDGAGSAAVGNERLAKLRDARTATGSGRVDDGGDDIDDEDDDAEDEEDDFDGSDGSDEEAGSDGDEEAPNAGNKFSKRAAKRWKKELMAKMEEYYKLDAEDFIDDMPCRFKYKQVAPSMYGLNTKEILAMTDKQLTQIMPLKKLAPYRHDSDMQTDAKVKARAQRMAREFLAEAEKSQKERKKNKGKKKRRLPAPTTTAATARARTRTRSRRPPRRSARLRTARRLGVNTTWTTSRGGSARQRRRPRTATDTTRRRRSQPQSTTLRPRGRARTPRKTQRSARRRRRRRRRRPPA